MKKTNNLKDYTDYTDSMYDEMKSLLNKSKTNVMVIKTDHILSIHYIHQHINVQQGAKLVTSIDDIVTEIACFNRLQQPKRPINKRSAAKLQTTDTIGLAKITALNH